MVVRLPRSESVAPEPLFMVGAVSQYIDELPLGNAVAIEFTGPILVAAAYTRNLRSGAALLLAAGGVVVLARVEAEGTMRGVGFALLAGLFWAGYIVLGHRVARGPAAVDGLGLGMLAGAAAISGFGATEVGSALSSPVVLLLALRRGSCPTGSPTGSTRWS